MDHLAISDIRAGMRQQRPSTTPQRFSTTPHFDLTSASSTAYIALPPLEAMSPERPPPKGPVESFFDRNVGLFFIASSQIFFSIMNLCAKLLSMGYPPIHVLEIIFLRMLITWLCALGYLHYTKVPDYLLGPRGIRLLLVIRGVVGFFGLFGIYYSLQYLELSDATVLTFLAPILTGYFGRVFLNEPFFRTELYAGVLSLVGVVLIARPQTLFGSQSSKAVDVTGLQRLSAVGVALLGVLGAAAAFTAIRAIGHRAHPLISVSMFALYSTLVSGIGLIFIGQPFLIPKTFAGWAEWIVICLSGFVAQFLLTAGLQREQAGRGVTMVYLQMVFAFAFERLVWSIIPDFLSLSGSGLILGGAIWVAVAKSRIKFERTDDLERSEYVRVGGEEEIRNPTEFESGAMSDEELRSTISSSISPRSESEAETKKPKGSEDENDRELGNRNVANNITDVMNWNENK